MALKDEIKTERKAYFKTATPKQKFLYLWEYYKVPAIIVTAIVIFSISFIYHKVTEPENLVNGMFLNIYSELSDTSTVGLKQDFLESQDLDPAKYDVSFNDSMNLVGNDTTDYDTRQAIWVQCGAGAIDFMVSPLNYITNYAYNDFYIDLRTVLSKEQIEKYGPYFLYVDGEVIKEINELSKDPDNNIKIQLPDASHPEEMEDPIPVLIDMAECEKLKDIYSFTIETPVFGILVNAKNVDMSIKVLDYLME